MYDGWLMHTMQETLIVCSEEKHGLLDLTHTGTQAGAHKTSHGVHRKTDLLQWMLKISSKILSNGQYI
jgi:hypothetical protein